MRRRVRWTKCQSVAGLAIITGFVVIFWCLYRKCCSHASSLRSTPDRNVYSKAPLKTHNTRQYNVLKGEKVTLDPNRLDEVSADLNFLKEVKRMNKKIKLEVNSEKRRVFEQNHRAADAAIPASTWEGPAPPEFPFRFTNINNNHIKDEQLSKMGRYVPKIDLISHENSHHASFHYPHYHHYHKVPNQTKLTLHSVNVQEKIPLKKSRKHNYRDHPHKLELLTKNRNSWHYNIKSAPPADAAGVFLRKNKNTGLLHHDDNALTSDQILDMKYGFRRHSFNARLSHEIPLDRDLLDTRPKLCRTQDYSNLTRQATVIICFHNEARSVLLRTVSSVLSRTPAHLLREVILVDDFSSYDYLKEKLENFVSSHHKIKLLRTKTRQGLIRARLMGVAVASGDTLVFLDSHCECNINWAEPLLSAIHKNPTSIVSPVVDIINDTSFEYLPGPEGVHGGFTWNLQFLWKPVPKQEEKQRLSETQPIRTPTMIGGLFAVDRAYFQLVGSYDSGMEIWGGENLELSFRVWMCGGTLEIIPCSRVGHVFRRIIPYGFPAGSRRTIFMNAARVAETWLDEYKVFFYASQHLTVEVGSLPGIDERKKLRSSLGCHNFTWYLQNVIPEMAIPSVNDTHFGQVVNRASALCLTWNEKNKLHLSSCVTFASNQVFHLTASNQLVHNHFCVAVVADSVQKLSCKQQLGKWHFWKDKYLTYRQTEGQRVKLCLSQQNSSLTTAQCNHGDSTQIWTFTYHFNYANVKYH